MTGCGFGPTTTSTDQPPAQPWGEPCITSWLAPWQELSTLWCAILDPATATFWVFTQPNGTTVTLSRLNCVNASGVTKYLSDRTLRETIWNTIKNTLESTLASSLESTREKFRELPREHSREHFREHSREKFREHSEITQRTCQSRPTFAKRHFIVQYYHLL